MRNTLTALAPTFVSRVRSRREAHQQHQTLARELAAFTTPSERLELDEIMARHTADETRLVQQLLRQQDVNHLLRQRRKPFAGLS
jgi:hypothetical protein